MTLNDSAVPGRPVVGHFPGPGAAAQTSEVGVKPLPLGAGKTVKDDHDQAALPASRTCAAPRNPYRPPQQRPAIADWRVWPVSEGGVKPCHLGNAALFDDEARTDEARALCKRGCTQLIECRFWALHHDVAGVCGGLTEPERASWRETFGVSLPAQPTVERVARERRDEIILQYLRGGSSAAEAGRTLGLNQRSVERVKRAHGFRPEDHPQAWRKNGLLALGAAS